MNQDNPKKNNPRVLTGVIVSDRMHNTAVISIDRLKKHPKIKKYYKITKRFKAHNENDQYKTGQKVIIRETRPMSKDKRWIITRKI